MAIEPRIALIHATRVAIKPVEDAAKKLWPEAELVSVLDEALSADRSSNRVSEEELNTRIVDLARYAERLEPDGLLYTCSAFGAGIEQAARTSPIPVLKPNEAMFEAALNYGDSIVMFYTFAPAAASMETEFSELVGVRQSSANLRSIYVSGAMDALKRGDAETHNRLVADAAAEIEADVIMLAHFSTAQAASVVRAASRIPVLTSPESAVAKLKSVVV